MRTRRAGLTALLLALAAGQSAAQEKLKLKVLYLGDASSPRAREYGEFLGTRFVRAEVAGRGEFEPASAGWADVVLLDWSQRDIQWQEREKIRSPLGSRAAWSRPTVLLGSAGLILSVPWQTTGSYG